MVEYLVGVLAVHRRTRYLAVRAGFLDWLALGEQRRFGMRRLPHLLVVPRKLRVALDGVAEVLHRSGGDAGCLEPVGRLPLVCHCGPWRDLGVELVLVGLAAGMRREARIVCEVEPTDHLAEHDELGVI